MARYSSIDKMVVGKRRKLNDRSVEKSDALRMLSDDVATCIMRCGLRDSASLASIANNISELIGQASRTKQLTVRDAG